jgi:hypothetical protein
MTDFINEIYDQEMINFIRKETISEITRGILEVQPLYNNPEIREAMSTIFKAGTDTQKLIDDGYEPVSNLGLLWIKSE